MGTDKELLVKGVKYLAITALTMFLAPVVIYQAFKNEAHPWYIPVLVIGLILALVAIALGFYSIKLLVDSLFGKKK
ncbi:DUF6095 family protein [Allomuricauda sp. d1]|uniref:DUF6095 family protein n=1 Tax=Allomuricauda sp. d1 TaxID=3136725 RepID=UPI0031DB78FA